MKNISSIILLILSITFTGTAFAQEGKIVAKPANNALLAPAHQIIFQLTTADTMAHKALMKQIGNITKVAPGTKIEVVCHGPGLDMLVADKSIVADKITKFAKSGIVFNACEFSMKERNVEKTRMLTDIGYVEAGIIAIVTRQEQGWSYIKAGF